MLPQKELVASTLTILKHKPSARKISLTKKQKGQEQEQGRSFDKTNEVSHTKELDVNPTVHQLSMRHENSNRRN